MTGTVLAAVDLDPQTPDVLGAAAAAADRLRWKVAVVHSSEGKRDKAEAERELADHVARHAADGSWQLADAPPGEAIADLARRFDAGLIVLGDHREGLLNDLFDVSTVEAVAERTGRMILVAGRQDSRSYRAIVVAVDFSPCSVRAARQAMAMFPDADIQLVHPFHVPFEGFVSGQDSREELQEQAERSMRQLIAQLPCPGAGAIGLRGLIREGETVGVLREAVERHRASLLVLGIEGEPGLLTGSLDNPARSLAQEPPCDVLLIQAPAGGPP